MKKVKMRPMAEGKNIPWKDYARLASDYDALQKENERLRSLINHDFDCDPECDSYGHTYTCKSVYFDQQLLAWKDRAERAERELAEVREQLAHSEQMEGQLEDQIERTELNLTAALERERECEDLIRTVYTTVSGIEYDTAFVNHPAVARALGREAS